jgi:HEAT repeat protein
MRHGLLGISLVLAAAAAALTLRDADAADDDLAARCEAVKWIEPLEVPPELQKIAGELVAAGKQSLSRIDAALGKSLKLRRIAPEVVAHWPGDPSRSILLRLLADPDELAAQNAAFYAGNVGGAELVQPLIDAGTKRGGMVRHNVINALGEVGGTHLGYDLIVAGLADRESWMRWSAVQALENVSAENRLEDAIARAEKVAESEKDPGARAAAQRTLRVLKARKG